MWWASCRQLAWIAVMADVSGQPGVRPEIKLAWQPVTLNKDPDAV
jgi:hypothetical protein